MSILVLIRPPLGHINQQAIHIGIWAFPTYLIWHTWQHHASDIQVNCSQVPWGHQTCYCHFRAQMQGYLMLLSSFLHCPRHLHQGGRLRLQVVQQPPRSLQPPLRLGLCSLGWILSQLQHLQQPMIPSTCRSVHASLALFHRIASNQPRACLSSGSSMLEVKALIVKAPFHGGKVTSMCFAGCCSSINTVKHCGYCAFRSLYVSSRTAYPAMCLVGTT